VLEVEWRSWVDCKFLTGSEMEALARLIAYGGRSANHEEPQTFNNNIQNTIYNTFDKTSLLCYRIILAPSLEMKKKTVSGWLV
jgi:hypothetical protein